MYQLLQGGFRVRATARGKKVAALKELYRPYPSIEVFDVPDLAESQFEAAFAGVDIVMHTAAPLPARVDLETMFAVGIWDYMPHDPLVQIADTTPTAS